MQFEEIKVLLEEKFPEAILDEDMDSTPKALKVESTQLHDVLEYLHADDKVYFDSLSSLTGLDNGVESETMEVVYHLYSIPFDHHLVVKTELDRDLPKIMTVSDIWRGAEWHEREAFDLLGIEFIGHPDLRRILLPDDWQGFPLRKDYVEQETYHDVKVKY